MRIDTQDVPRPGPVWIIAEPAGTADGVRDVSLELLGVARRLSTDLKAATGPTAVLIGHELDRAAATLAMFGAEVVLAADSPDLAVFRDESFAGILADMIRTYQPQIVLGGATAVGRALLPRVAVQVRAGLTADCTDLEIDPETGLLLQTRPAFGGNILATIVCRTHRPQMATVRPGVFPRPERLDDAPVQANVVRWPVSPSDPMAAVKRLLAFHRREGGGGELREARIVVSAGYGVGGPGGVELVQRVAELLGGALGASRAAVDAGWVDYRHQVGQTGVTVQPDLYIACGISGAVQHVAGMQNSGTIVAVNRDPDAPIFQYADIAVVGDVFDVLPELLKVLEAERRTAAQDASGGE